MESLADIKIEAIDAQELLREKDQEIAELKKALTNKAKVARICDAYYETN